MDTVVSKDEVFKTGMSNSQHYAILNTKTGGSLLRLCIINCYKIKLF